MNPSYLLFFVFFVKHFLADFPLQSLWMKKNKGTNVRALFAHSGIHIVLTALILAFVKPPFWAFAFIVFFEFLFHSMVDYLKSQKEFGGKYSYEDKKYWFFYGLDQLLHHTSYLIMVMIMVNGS